MRLNRTAIPEEHLLDRIAFTANSVRCLDGAFGLLGTGFTEGLDDLFE